MPRRLIAAAALAAALAGPAAAEPFRLIVTDMETPLVPNSVMELAEQEGYFDRAGVDVEFVRVQQTPLAMAALRAGEGEMANVAVEALLQAVAQGAADLRAVMSPNRSLPYLIAGRDVASVADLAGKRFGIGRVGSVDQLLSSKVLASQGIDMAGLELVALGQPQARAQALVAGQIDATTMSIGAFTAIDGDPAIKVLVDVEDYYRAAPILSKLNAVRSDTLASREKEVEAVIEAVTLASRDFAADPDKWVAAMRKARPDVDEADLKLLAAAFAGSWSIDGGISAPELEAAQAWLHEGEDFAGIAPAPLDAWVDLAPLDAVIARIGAPDPAIVPTR
ncbi:ABC transporter substrate-binding protein [Amaricoccus sp.]|uniref:ABC transporter substrate-binding protein n=1 Tax=Amaricoccus sp. TaxID=1872485 RepID=UPI001B6B8077|nr:ABC transporter substrate-binding protein [Amaricoccus sp.]MBP7002576.1 ABC transporter substrate-binding protein [Amaricoccus sp.]